MNKEEQGVGFSCYDNIYLRFKYIGDDEFDELIEYIEDNHISYEGATDTFIDLEQENKQLKERVIIMEKYLELISDLALDYDGCNTIESLKCLIDELKRFAMLGRVCNTTETIYINDNKAYNILHEEIKGSDNNG